MSGGLLGDRLVTALFDCSEQFIVFTGNRDSTTIFDLRQDFPSLWGLGVDPGIGDHEFAGFINGQIGGAVLPEINRDESVSAWFPLRFGGCRFLLGGGA